MKYAQLVMGPAGSGKSTYCQHLQLHCENKKRSVHIVNLDPAAEYFGYSPSVDIKDLITLDDVAEELNFGPNGGLIYCMEFLTNNLDWLEEELGNFEDDYLIFDCPGQIELYTHFPVMKVIKDFLLKQGYNVCAVYTIDSQFVEDTAKFFSGVLSALATMVQLEVPHINVLTKMDLFEQNAPPGEIDKFLDTDTDALLEKLNKSTTSKFANLNRAFAQLIEEYNMVSFVPLNIKDEDSLELVLSHVDNAIQFGEDEEPKEPKDEEDEDED